LPMYLFLSSTIFFLSSTHPPPRSTLFPYTTLFRSHDAVHIVRRGVQADDDVAAAVTQALENREENLFVVVARTVWLNARSEMVRSEEHTSELQSRSDLVCRLLLEKKKKNER